eukprot:m.111705 g.111705  ORF g.111705 m.111705 type:complete len:306 (+) comp17007_c0_seq40:2863-3780(+)
MHTHPQPEGEKQPQSLDEPPWRQVGSKLQKKNFPVQRKSLRDRVVAQLERKIPGCKVIRTGSKKKSTAVCVQGIFPDVDLLVVFHAEVHFSWHEWMQFRHGNEKIFNLGASVPLFTDAIQNAFVESRGRVDLPSIAYRFPLSIQGPGENPVLPFDITPALKVFVEGKEMNQYHVIPSTWDSWIVTDAAKHAEIWIGYNKMGRLGAFKDILRVLKLLAVQKGDTSSSYFLTCFLCDYFNYKNTIGGSLGSSAETLMDVIQRLTAAVRAGHFVPDMQNPSRNVNVNMLALKVVFDRLTTIEDVKNAL